jgi:hypothetical protein
MAFMRFMFQARFRALLSQGSVLSPTSYFVV